MFLDLNQNIGGYDTDGNYVSTRTVGDLEALRLVYQTGRVTYDGQGLRKFISEAVPFRIAGRDRSRERSRNLHGSQARHHYQYRGGNHA